MLNALLCPNCGAPLPAEAATRPFVTCAYCRTTSNASGAMIERHTTLPEEAEDPPQDDWERRIWEEEREEQRKKNAWKAFQDEVVGLGSITFEGLRDASQRHLTALGQNEGLARVTFGLVRDYEQEHDVDLSRQPIVYWRVADGYIKTVRALVKSETFLLKMPFFASTDQGPLHYERELTVPLLQELARRPPEPAPKKGFWSKLFG